MSTLRRFWADERGTETVEWAIIIGIIAVAAVATISAIGGKVANAFTRLDTALP
jgi:Flp pilus assembly pilin Flp